MKVDVESVVTITGADSQCNADLHFVAFTQLILSFAPHLLPSLFNRALRRVINVRPKARSLFGHILVRKKNTGDQRSSPVTNECRREAIGSDD